MSLSFQGEHYAWQQRVVHEKTKLDTFDNTYGPFASPKAHGRYPVGMKSDYASNYRRTHGNAPFELGKTTYTRHSWDGRCDFGSTSYRSPEKKPHAGEKTRMNEREYLSYLDNSLKKAMVAKFQGKRKSIN